MVFFAESNCCTERGPTIKRQSVKTEKAPAILVDNFKLLIFTVIPCFVAWKKVHVQEVSANLQKKLAEGFFLCLLFQWVTNVIDSDYCSGRIFQRSIACFVWCS